MWTGGGVAWAVSGARKCESLDVVAFLHGELEICEGDEYCERAAVDMGTKESLVIEDERESLRLEMCLPEVSCRIPHTLAFPL